MYKQLLPSNNNCPLFPHNSVTLLAVSLALASSLQSTTGVSSRCAANLANTLWLRKLADDLGFASGAVCIDVDSQGALSLGNNPITSARSKHVDVQHHLVRERVTRGEVKLEYCATERMVADIFTKPLGEAKFVWCREALGLK